MWTLKSAVIVYSALFCLSLEVHSHTLKRNWTASYDFFYPKIVTVNNTMLTIGLDNKTIVISPTETTEQFRDCRLPLLPVNLFSEREYAYVLGNGKIVFVVTVFTLLLDFEDYSNLYVIVDPATCSSTKPIETYLGQTRHIEALVPYYDSFDIFYKSSQEHWLNKSTLPKTPLRYNDLGEQIELDYFFDLETEITSLQIQPIKSYDASEGYLCTVGIDESNVTLKRLDSQFKMLKQMEVVIEDLRSVSLTHGRVSFCHNTLAYKGVYTFWTNFGYLNKTCEFLDADLQRRAMISYDQLQQFEGGMLNASFKTIPTNLPGWNTVILQTYYYTKNILDHTNPATIYYYLDRVYPNGTTKLIARSNHEQISNHQISFGVYAGDFCTIIMSSGWITRHINTTCIDIASESSR